MSVERKARDFGCSVETILNSNPSWADYVHLVRIVDFTVGVPADEGGTCEDGVSPRPDEEIRCALFVQTSTASFEGVLYETHRWPGSRRLKLSVGHCTNLGNHDYLANEAAVGFIWKKDFEKDIPDIIKAIPTPDPSGICAPANMPDGNPLLSGLDLPPQNSIEWTKRVIKALRARGFLMHKAPKDWYFDQSGEFHERGRSRRAEGGTEASLGT